MVMNFLVSDIWIPLAPNDHLKHMQREKVQLSQIFSSFENGSVDRIHKVTEVSMGSSMQVTHLR